MNDSEGIEGVSDGMEIDSHFQGMKSWDIRHVPHTSKYKNLYSFYSY